MAMVDTQVVVDNLPADGSSIPYDDFLQVIITKAGVMASRNILAAKKKGLTKQELVVNSDGSNVLYISRRVQGEAKSAVTLSEELSGKIQREIRARTTGTKKDGA